MKDNIRTKKENQQVQSEPKAILENEMEANRYAARCLVACAIVGTIAWIFNFVGIFIIPPLVMNIAMPLMIVFFLLPSVACKLTDGKPGWIKFFNLLCVIIGVFILSSAMPKHGVLTWALPLMLSCHYYSKRVTQLTLVLSWILFSASIYIGLYIGEGDMNLLTGVGIGGNREITDEMIFNASLFFVLPRALILLGLSSICTTMATRTRMLLHRQIRDSEERQRISTELDVATHIQADMLPRIFPAFSDRAEFDIYASMNPAKEVGGDFYDFFMVDEKHLAIVIADVSGKGVPAALFMVIGKTLIKDHTKPGVDLGAVFSEVNDLLCESNSEGLFITAFEGVLDLETGDFTYVNAGHEIPFIAKAGGIYEPYKLQPGFVLAGMEHMKYQSGRITLSPGDKLFQYTDGITEATNAEKELYGMNRLTDVLVKNTGCTPAALLPAVKADIDAFVGDAPQFDDITMLCVEYIKPMAVTEN